MYPIDFVSYYSFENFDFELVNEKIDFVLDRSSLIDFNLVDNERIDFAIDNSKNIDFVIDVTTPVDDYIPALSNFKPQPDDVIPYGENYLITEDEIPMTTEDNYYLMY